MNSVIDSPPYDTVSEEARKFVQILLQKQRIQVGSLAESDEWLLLPWPGTKEEHITHVLASIVLGNSMVKRGQPFNIDIFSEKGDSHEWR